MAVAATALASWWVLGGIALAVLAVLALVFALQRRALARYDDLQRQVRIRTESLAETNLRLTAERAQAAELALERLQQKEALSLRERELQATTQALEAANATVRQHVSELESQRAALVAANAELAQSLTTIAEQQRQLVAAEQLTLLAKITANVAHTANTPLGVLLSAGEAWERQLATLLAPTALGALWQVVAGQPVYLPSPAEARAARKALAEHLPSWVADPADWAQRLAAVGVTPNRWGAFAGALQGPDDLLALETLLRMRQTTANLVQSARRLQASVLTLQHASGETAEPPAQVDLVQSVRQALAHVEAASSAALKYQFTAGPVPPVVGYPLALQALWDTLLRNAEHALRAAGGGTVRVAVLPEGPLQVKVSVADTGPGLAPEVVGRLFEPFVTTKAHGEGLGLGLYLAQRIAQRHGGAVTLGRVGGETVAEVILSVRASGAVLTAKKP